MEENVSGPELQRPAATATNAEHAPSQELEFLQVAPVLYQLRIFDPMQQEVENATIKTLAGLSLPGQTTEAMRWQQPTGEDCSLAQEDELIPHVAQEAAAVENNKQGHAHEEPGVLQAAQSPADEFLSAIVKPTQAVSAIAQPQTPAAPLQKKQNPVSSLRRSRRIANTGGQAPALEKAQGVLMRKLGIVTERESITAEAREAYAKLFDNPLSRPQVAALAALFGWEIPSDCEARSAELLS